LEEARRVVEALMKVGPRFSDISRATGIPVSTVRYIVLKRLPKLGLSVRASINYGALGLQRYLVEFRSSYTPYHISKILDLLGEFMYLDYYTYSMNEKKFFAIFAVPPKFEKSFLEFLHTIDALGLMKDIEIKRLDYMRILPFMIEFFDFSKGIWLQDWMNRLVVREVQEVVEHPSPDPKIDKLDLMIIAELQKKVVPFKYNELVKKFNLSRQTISKHYKHVLKLVNLFAVIWVPFAHPELIVTPLLIKSNYDSDVRKTFLRIPFTYAEMRSSNREYFAMLIIPSVGFYTTMKFLTDFVEIKELNFQDMEYSGKFSVPYELYKDSGWINSFERGIEKLVELKNIQKKEFG